MKLNLFYKKFKGLFNFNELLIKKKDDKLIFRKILKVGFVLNNLRLYECLIKFKLEEMVCKLC